MYKFSLSLYIHIYIQIYLGFEEQGGLQGDTVLYLFLIYVIVFLMCMGGTKTLKGAGIYILVASGHTH